jgi:hypothetical protein
VSNLITPLRCEGRRLTSVLRSEQFAAGYFAGQDDSSGYTLLVEFEKKDKVNTTLAPFSLCANANDSTLYEFGTAQAQRWADTYTRSTIDRFHTMTNVIFNSTDIIDMQETCAYEASRGRGVALSTMN